MLRDARCFQEWYVPDDIPHRNQELNQLARGLRPVQDGELGEPSLVTGPSGTGKTCIAKFSLDRLEENSFDVRTQYVNCWSENSQFSILYTILDGINRTVDVHRRSTPRDELLKRLQEFDEAQYVVVLDEVDMVEDDKVLYDLYRIQNITPILIANREEDLFAQLDDRLVSRLHSVRRLELQRYSIEELVSILQDRVECGLHPDLIDSEKLEIIADRAVGDARIAIGILRNAAREVDEGQHDRISAELIEQSVPEVKDELRKKDENRLTSHQQAVLDILREHGELRPGNLYDHYEEKVDDPKTDRTIRNYLQKMNDYDLIKAEGEKRARTYKAL